MDSPVLNTEVISEKETTSPSSERLVSNGEGDK